MQTFMWRESRLQLHSFNVAVGSYQLELRRCHASTDGPPVVMVAGFLETADIFLPHKGEGGLAALLASQGYDVYLAELRGRGKSWPAVGADSGWGLHEAITEDIPALLQKVARLRPAVPQFWLGQDLSSLLLLAHFARSQALAAPVAGMIHLTPFRRCDAATPHPNRDYRLWQLLLTAMKSWRGYPSLPFVEAGRRETKTSLAEWQRWHCTETWTDASDGFDYSQALHRRHLPPSLYVANHEAALGGKLSDVRQLIAELPSHNARVLTVGKAGGNRRNYSHRQLLSHPAACDDHLPQLLPWLEEFSSAPLSAAG